MAVEYNVEICKKLEAEFHAAKLHRPMRIGRYDAGTELTYIANGFGKTEQARVHLVIEKFVGGGFAGQVYLVKITGIDGAIEGLQPGQSCAMKILIPPSGFSRLFRNLLYWIGFQGPFQLQVNPAASKAGALWQKFIRRGAKIRFGDETAVRDIYATFVDDKLGSCGQLSEWIEGRTWRLEVDDRVDLLTKWRHNKLLDESAISQLGSPEYREKRRFMGEFVELLHDMGGHEFARQYEWSTCKSQPNVLKRHETNDNPSGGLVAVDFRAGMTLLPFLPMSPGDFKLIGRGFMRGSLVQFDRGDINKLEAFIQAHGEEFTDMQQKLEDLKNAEQIYRNSIPDITHNHIRLLYSGKLWSTIFSSTVTGWSVRNLIDDRYEHKLRSSRILTLAFFFIGVIPFLGKLIRRICGRTDWRRHYGQMLTSWKYFHRALRGRMAEKVIIWHRAGRLDAEGANKVATKPWRFFCHLPLSILPAGFHKFLTDSKFRKDKLVYIFLRPFRLYFKSELREQWLRDMVTSGQQKHILSDEDAQTILSQVNEPFIQKYLKSLAVHVCTLPVTQIVSVMVAWIYARMHPEFSPAETAVAVTAILVLFQITPISPGSLVRGLYVLYLVIREWNFKDYNIAVFLGFFKYVGYLAFPIQMTYHYPALARFMAAHWATEAVHIVPVFGERGALLEHWVFGLFYNRPLTIRRRMRKRAELRASLKPRYWHVGLSAIGIVAIFALAEFLYIKNTGISPVYNKLWWLAVLVPLICGAIVTLGCGGAALGKRLVAAAVCGVLIGVLSATVSAILSYNSGFVVSCVWRVFIFAIMSTIGAIITELKLPNTDME
ncbi:MAG: YrzE family protein [Planctomycetes bacterium]|nr:YrzE family protein [Planctomycetota bacterium]